VRLLLALCCLGPLMLLGSDECWLLSTGGRFLCLNLHYGFVQCIPSQHHPLRLGVYLLSIGTLVIGVFSPIASDLYSHCLLVMFHTRRLGVWVASSISSNGFLDALGCEEYDSFGYWCVLVECGVCSFTPVASTCPLGTMLFWFWWVSNLLTISWSISSELKCLNLQLPPFLHLPFKWNLQMLFWNN